RALPRGRATARRLSAAIRTDTQAAVGSASAILDECQVMDNRFDRLPEIAAGTGSDSRKRPRLSGKVITETGTTAGAALALGPRIRDIALRATAPHQRRAIVRLDTTVRLTTARPLFVAAEAVVEVGTEAVVEADARVAAGMAVAATTAR